MDSYDSEYMIQFAPDCDDICPDCEYPLDDHGSCDFCE